MKELKIGIAGLGTVGVGVFKIISEQADMLAKRCGKRLKVVAVSSRDKNSDRGIKLDGLTWYDNALDMASDAEIDIVVESIGGTHGIAKELCKLSLENGKDFVTANKALIAVYGEKFAKLAEKNNAALSFEAAVAGGIPILKNIREGLSANEFTKIGGILNGTCNYILTSMAKDNRDFDDVLQEAMDKGYAETPPDLDIDGIDTAHKLVILTSLAFGCPVNFNSIYTEGIRHISLDDIKYAKELGYNIKLLGIANIHPCGTKVEQRVHPCMIPESAPIGQVDGVLNAVFTECNYFGQGLMTGAGAGEGPTASSVVADIIDIASGRTGNPFGVATKDMKNIETIDIDQHIGEYYIRTKVTDKSGVLASLTSLFSDEKIGVDSVLQKADESDNTAQIAIITHETSENAIKKLLTNIEKMDYVVEEPHMIRIERF